MRWQVPTLLTHLARSLNEGSPDVRFLNAKALFVFFSDRQQKHSEAICCKGMVEKEDLNSTNFDGYFR